jgi:hypothetical protein
MHNPGGVDVVAVELSCENEMQDGGCDARGSNNILPATALQDGVFGGGGGFTYISEN